jgi:hypothetical protein
VRQNRTTGEAAWGRGQELKKQGMRFLSIICIGGFIRTLREAGDFFFCTSGEVGGRIARHPSPLDF